MFMVKLMNIFFFFKMSYDFLLNMQSDIVQSKGQQGRTDLKEKKQNQINESNDN